MLTLDQVLEEQKDIRKLCLPKTENRFEAYGPNDNYGMAYVMKKYAGYPIDRPIYATFPHGVYLRDKVISKSELEVELPAHLNYPPFTQALWKKAAKGKQIIPFAAPIHYAVKQFKSEVAESDRKGTLFLPLHSTAIVNVEFDKEAVIEELKNLPEEFHPITVCVHWQDVERGLHKYFQSHGFNVVSAGHFTDCDYLFRWLHLASQYKLISHCGLGSALFYSIVAGHPFYLTNVDAELHQEQGIELFNKKVTHYSSDAQKREKQLRSLFGKPSSQITQQQKDIVDHYTNASLVKSPEALNKQFQKLDKMYQAYK